MLSCGRCILGKGPTVPQQKEDLSHDNDEACSFDCCGKHTLSSKQQLTMGSTGNAQKEAANSLLGLADPNASAEAEVRLGLLPLAGCF